jgi:hypothetical protein
MEGEVVISTVGILGWECYDQRINGILDELIELLFFYWYGWLYRKKEKQEGG